MEEPNGTSWHQQEPTVARRLTIRTTHRGSTAFRAPLFFALTLTACGVLSHPINDDGTDVTNPNATNPGSQQLTLSSARTDLGVGDYQAIIATFGGATLTSTLVIPSTVSDPSVLAGSAFGARALSVGAATITVNYFLSTATIGFTVHPQYGLSAIVNSTVDGVTGDPAWFPGTIRVSAGATVQFNIGSTHNVVFTPVPGAPPDIQLGATGAGTDRLFQTTGSFAYTCTLHGEAGVVNVTP